MRCMVLCNTVDFVRAHRRVQAEGAKVGGDPAVRHSSLTPQVWPIDCDTTLQQGSQPYAVYAAASANTRPISQDSMGACGGGPSCRFAALGPALRQRALSVYRGQRAWGLSFQQAPAHQHSSHVAAYRLPRCDDYAHVYSGLYRAQGGASVSRSSHSATQQAVTASGMRHFVCQYQMSGASREARHNMFRYLYIFQVQL